MTPFPVTRSNLSAKHLGQYIQEHYFVGSNVRCSILRSGVNDSYLVESEDNKSIFRVYSLNWRTREEILEEILILNLLKQNGLSISFSLPDIYGEHIQIFNAPEGERYGVLFSYAP